MGQSELDELTESRGMLLAKFLFGADHSHEHAVYGGKELNVSFLPIVKSSAKVLAV